MRVADGDVSIGRMMVIQVPNPQLGTPDDAVCVLVVEDDAMLRKVVVKILSNWGYAIREAPDGGAAIEEFRRPGTSLNVVLLDIMLPVLDGVSVARLLLRDNPDLPIVACSAALNQDVMADLREAGVRHFLAKPYSADTLRDALNRAMAS